MCTDTELFVAECSAIQSASDEEILDDLKIIMRSEIQENNFHEILRLVRKYQQKAVLEAINLHHQLAESSQ